MSGAPWALAAAGLLALAGGARRGARQVVPSQVIQEAKDLSRKFRQDFPSWRKDFEEEPVFNLFWGRLDEIFKGHKVLGGGTQRVVLASRDPRYVIKLTHEPEGNLYEAAAWQEAGPETRKLLVPVVAVDPEGHWLIMERVTPTSWCEFEDPYPPGMLDLKRRFKALGFLDWQDHNVSEDMRVYDYAEDVSLKGSPARRLPPGLKPGETRRFNAIYRSLQGTVRKVTKTYEVGFGASGYDDMLAYEEIANWRKNVGLPFLGEGTFRWVFDLGEERVLKLEVGLGEYYDYGDESGENWEWNGEPSLSTITEARRWATATPAQRERLVPVLASDPQGRWLVMEKTEPLMKGYDLYEDLELYGRVSVQRMKGVPKKTRQVAKQIGVPPEEIRSGNLDTRYRLLDYGL